jgi:Transposase DDE domain
MPFKANAAGRHHILRQRQRVTNWSQYDAALRQRGSLTIWVTEEAIAAWQAEPRTTRGGQPQYAPLAITTALTLRAVFRVSTPRWHRASSKVTSPDHRIAYHVRYRAFADIGRF